MLYTTSYDGLLFTAIAIAIVIATGPTAVIDQTLTFTSVQLIYSKAG